MDDINGDGIMLPIRYMIDSINLNTIYRLFPNGVEEYNEFDSNNNRVHTFTNNGYEEWCSYNEKNQMIHLENANIGIDYEYDDMGNCIHEIYSNGYEVFNKFDDDGNYLGSYNNIT